MLSSGLTTVTPLALKEKDIETRVLEKYRQRPEDKRRGRLILISLLSVFFCCFAVAWRSEDNDVIINRTLSYQIRSERYIQKCARDFFFSLASVIGLRGLFPANFSIVSMCKDDIS